MHDIYPWIMIILVWLAAYSAIVAVHECGHYFAGLIIGVPPHEMKIRLLRFPQHVALKDGQEWVSPMEIERYIKLAETYMPTTGKALIFVAGGFVLETLALLGWVMFKLPYYREVITLALLMTLIYLVADIALYTKTSKASMDFSAMHSISPVWGGLIVVALVGLQCLIFMLR